MALKELLEPAPTRVRLSRRRTAGSNRGSTGATANCFLSLTRSANEHQAHSLGPGPTDSGEGDSGRHRTPSSIVPVPFQEWPWRYPVYQSTGAIEDFELERTRAPGQLDANRVACGIRPSA